MHCYPVFKAGTPNYQSIQEKAAAFYSLRLLLSQQVRFGLRNLGHHSKASKPLSSLVSPVIVKNNFYKYLKSFFYILQLVPNIASNIFSRFYKENGSQGNY